MIETLPNVNFKSQSNRKALLLCDTSMFHIDAGITGAIRYAARNDDTVPLISLLDFHATRLPPPGRSRYRD
jgi:hypothetical protein